MLKCERNTFNVICSALLFVLGTAAVKLIHKSEGSCHQ